MRVSKMGLAVVVLAATITGVTAAEAAPAAGPVGQITDRVARAIAVEVGHGPVPAVGTDGVDARSVGAGAVRRAVDRANADLLAAKGLPAGSADLLRVRLGDSGMAAALAGGEKPLVAAVPDDDEGTTFRAYAPGGGARTLTLGVIPDQPVLLVEVDVETATTIGMDVVREAVAAKGLAAERAAARGGYWATKVNRIRVGDKQEPWPKGKAEMFTLVGGFGPQGRVAIDPVDMPYLDDEDRDYYPGQLVVHWNHFKYNAADIVLMEDDGDTNYQSLAQTLISALLTIVDGGAHIPLVNAIINAMPGKWWTDDPDYVDSWYTLTTQSAGTFTGAAGNATIDIAPYWVGEV
ncbi:DUF3103 family protein [Actinokineospora pegani]|uniref:DUF3103 family protein n=1 Tax=Actinokineospora pegani TaxID=2654637 RepID=UPI0012EB0444|nr:DUF3103 family protein [Actinokineospora pegani]